MSGRLTRFAAFTSAALAICVAACGSLGPHAALVEEPTSALPSAPTLTAEAQTHFERGEFGLAVDNFAKAVEIDPSNAEAWLGLAASYDHVRRFDLADKAYASVQRLIGPTPSVLNNLGYSYFLRGELERSRSTLAAAYQGDPRNPYIRSNIGLLNERLAELGKPVLVVN